jgi:hypothetical protein
MGRVHEVGGMQITLAAGLFGVEISHELASVIFGLFLTFFTGILVLKKRQMQGKLKIMRAEGVQTEAVVNDKMEEVDDKKSYSFYVSLTFAYDDADGNRVRVTHGKYEIGGDSVKVNGLVPGARKFWSDLNVGGKVTVRYLPKEPRAIMLIDSEGKEDNLAESPGCIFNCVLVVGVLLGFSPVLTRQVGYTILYVIVLGVMLGGINRAFFSSRPEAIWEIYDLFLARGWASTSSHDYKVEIDKNGTAELEPTQVNTLVGVATSESGP